jgi:pyruvate dehydrogenase phosphatase regulatory subunit
MVISPVTQQTRNMKWLSEHFPEDGSVLMSDITSLYAAINVVGPKAVDLLSELTDESLSKADFPQFTCKEIDVGYASGIKAMRITHTGEDGFNLYVPTEYALHVYDILMEKGRNYGIINAGYFALRTLRIEKMFAFWGQDLDKNTTPYECNRDFRVKLETKDFIGKMALMQLKDQRIKRRFVQLVLEDHDLYQNPWPWGGEPIYRNGKFCGFTTSTTYAYSLEKQVSCLFEFWGKKM